MAYTYITDLPPQVRSVLTPALQQLWLDTYSTAMMVCNDDGQSSALAWMKVFQTANPGEIGPPKTQPISTPPVGQSTGAAEMVPQMADHPFSYVVSLADLAMDGSRVSWIQAMPFGKYDHPVYKKIDLTQERVQQFATNIKNNVRGIQLDIDYDHKAKTDEAAGWVTDAQVRTDGLWIAVEWTPKAADKIKNKEYRYFSPEFADSWKHPKTGQVYKDVMFGGAITNRPFLKDILPINLSEVGGMGFMDPLKEVKAALGLADDAADSDVMTKIAELNTPKSDPAQGNGGTGDAQLSDTKDPMQQAKLLAESDPVVKALMERLNMLEDSNKLSEVNRHLSELSHGKNAVVAPAHIDELRGLALQMPVALSDKFFTVLSKIVDGGIVQLGEQTGNGNVKSDKGNDGDPIKAFSDKVDALTTGEKKLSYNEAVLQVAADEPDLYLDYRNASYIVEGAR